MSHEIQTQSEQDRPRTRLAPSPTGALHLGNARTFLVNWALARRNGWEIVLRIEDLDTPRVKAGAIEETIEILGWLGMDWDRGPTIQSADLEPYRDAMRKLAASGSVFPCSLTRTEIEASASAPQEGVHEIRFGPELRPQDRPARFADEQTNWRLEVPNEPVSFVDGLRGSLAVNPSEEVGDFVVWTRRGQPSYQLAVVVDDHRQGVTQIVRGDDLLGSTGRQILLARALELDWRVGYTHLPLVRGADGRRLAKRHGDTRLSSYRGMGVRPERVIGILGWWCGLIAERAEMSATEFSSALELDKIGRDDIVFTQEDEQWLAART